VYVIEVGRCGYLGGTLLLYVMTKLIQLGLWYIICAVELYRHIYLSIYIYNVQYNTNMCGFKK